MNPVVGIDVSKGESEGFIFLEVIILNSIDSPAGKKIKAEKSEDRYGRR